MNPIASNVAAIPRSDFPSARSLRARVTVARATSFAASIASRPPVRRRFAPSRYDVAVRPAFRLSLVVFGLAAIAYGTATLTGRWLGTPPWWEREAEGYNRSLEQLLVGEGTLAIPNYVPGDPRWDASIAKYVNPDGVGYRDALDPKSRREIEQYLAEQLRRGGREWISGGIVAAGLALAAFVAWPRRRRRVATT